MYSRTSDILNALNTTLYEAFIREDPDEDENQPGSEGNDSPLIIPPMLDINITWQGVKKLIEGLNSGKSPGPDDISPKLLKLIPCEAASFPKVIFENSLRTSEVPDDCNLANITPLYKKGI